MTKILHIASYYRGLLEDVNIIKEAFKAAKAFIEKIKLRKKLNKKNNLTDFMVYDIKKGERKARGSKPLTFLVLPITASRLEEAISG